MLISLINITQNLLYSIKIRLNPNDPKVYYDKGRTLEKYKAALKFNKALELGPDNPDASTRKQLLLDMQK
ncbi:tetratricopeptide repeat family protein [Rickettsia endosymbiont of Ixodes pacificus]|uniref:tetratricopeptide repeat protein n=1 Tax=Rickettsia endosymbiont of Ixodes pacificus TaxID=1133329 RepID=UPI0005F7E36C|nr:hypothetical protein [Rickettsia endosymbiont of Ixodes pacificus]KJW03331.1 tetratricopeptide repeat family protein [Rickettsia endosymbiont of Ixodes pacificus]